MRDRLIQYVELLFAAAPNSTEIKQEILQNTLDRYDDLLAQGKTPEAAYQLAISGIGDINEILGNPAAETYTYSNTYQDASLVTRSAYQDEEAQARSRKYRAIAIAMYILSAIPLFILSEFGAATLGLCLTIGLVAAGTYTIMLAKKDDLEETETQSVTVEPAVSARKQLRESIGSFIGVLGLAAYLIISFWTHAWYITWIIFPLIGCVRGLVNAILDLKEVNQNES